MQFYMNSIKMRMTCYDLLKRKRDSFNIFPEKRLILWDFKLFEYLLNHIFDITLNLDMNKQIL